MIKIKLLLAIFAFATISAVSYTTYDNMPMSNVDQLMFSNVEALTTGESLSDKVWHRYNYTNDNGTAGVNCWKGGSQNCKLN